MKEKLGAMLLAVCITVIGYILVSSAAAHTERDHTALQQWKMEWSSRK